jgi:type VI secretion system protein ImpC
MLDAAALCQALAQSHPQAARLALLCCLPVRVTPALVRMVRLRLLPRASTGDEADLWLSDLVDTRSSGGFALERSVRAHLREQLAAQPTLLDELWHRVHVEHGAWLSARARLEEELTWRLLHDPTDPWIEQQWQAVIDEMKQSDQPEGLARWVVRAMTDLPPGSRKHPAGQLVWFGANLMLGNASVLGEETQSFLDTRALSYALDRLPRRSVHVARTEQGVLISPLQPIENGFVVEVPATQPIWVQIEPHDGDAGFAPMALLLHAHETQHVEVKAQTLRLRWIDGSVQALGPEQTSTENLIPRNRRPRVQITYDVEVGDTVKQVELPFVMGVLADLSGMPTEPLASVSDRKFLEIDADNFDARMRAFKPRVAFWMNEPLGELENPTRLRLDLTFESMESFRPDKFVQQIEPLHRRVLARCNLHNLVTYLEGKAEAKALLEQALRNPAEVKRLSAAGKTPSQRHMQLVEQLMRFNDHGSPVEIERILDSGLQALVQLTLNRPLGQEHDLAQHVAAIMGQIDALLSKPLNAILHHPEFKKLESAWRGLHYLVHNTETSEQLKIRVMNISKDELPKALFLHQPQHWDQSTLHKKIYDDEYGQFGGEPFGCLVGDFEFDHSATDVALLRGLAKVANAAHTVFLSNAKPSLLHMESWRDLSRPRDLLKITQMHEYADWQALRESEAARHLGLCLPRMLARLPYGAMTHPVEDFDFEEVAMSKSLDPHCWIGSAYAMATNIGRAFKEYGWCANIRGVESGGAVMNLVTHVTVTDQGEPDLTCPTESSVSDRREAELSKMGLMALVHRPNTDFAAFVTAGSLHHPAEYEDDAEATYNGRLNARLPYFFAANRFAQYLQCIMRDKVGSFHTASLMSEFLNRWLSQYVDGDPANSTQATRAMHPLASARVEVHEQNPSEHLYRAELKVLPHHQLEGLSQPMRISVQFPSGTFG